ncbi:MAG: cupredoxin domain-containing protein [Candidatus Rokuibacteriota bacterium]
MRARVACGVALALAVAGLAAAAAGGETREFMLVTNEIKWQAKAGEAAVVDRDRGPVKEIERYTFDPGFLIVNQGDRVVLKVHTLKGSKHVVEVPAFKTGEVPIARGQERAVTFVADRPGVFEIKCRIHENAGEEGPMVGYLYVMGR